MRIIYNVTVNVLPDISAKWLKWMKDSHLNEVLNTGCFTHYNLCKMLTRQDDEVWDTFVVQYFAPDISYFHKYEDLFAEAIRKKGNHLFEGKVLIYRSLMEMLDFPEKT